MDEKLTDQLTDIINGLEDLVDATKQTVPVEVNVPPMPAPVVKIAAPTAPPAPAPQVTVEPQITVENVRTACTIRVMERDRSGKILELSVRPA